MRGHKCGVSCLCPVSFGLALGITTAIVVFLCFTWAMFHGVSPMMEAMRFPAHPTWGETWVYTLWALVKGFVFGLILALFYDWIVCLGRCGKKGGDCGCGCAKCSGGDDCGCGCCTKKTVKLKNK